MMDDGRCCILFSWQAVTENPELKNKIFKDLDEFTPKGAILATNTSSISITKIASATKRPELVLSPFLEQDLPNPEN